MPKIKGAQIRDENIDGSKIENDSLTGDDIDESTLIMTLDDVLSDGASSTVTMNTGSIIPSSNQIYDLGNSSFSWASSYIKDLNVLNQLTLSSTTSSQELVRLQKNDADTRYMVFESEGVDKFEMSLNSFENFTFTTTDTTDDILFRLNGHTAIYMDGYPKEVRIWDSHNSAYNTQINSTLQITDQTTAQNIMPETTNTYNLGASDGTNVWAGVYATEIAANNIEVFNNLTLSGSDISFSDNNGTYPTDSGGFFWDLNNDEARIYAVQPGSDQISFIFKLSDNSNTSNDRFVFWNEDYRSNSGNNFEYDKFPLTFYGEQMYLFSPSNSTTQGVPEFGKSMFRFTDSGLFAIKSRTGGDPATLNDYCHIYAKDVSSSSELFVRDEAGNVTQISPHNEDGEWHYFSKNVKTGKVVRINMEKMIRRLEEITGESFIEEWIEDES